MQRPTLLHLIATSVLITSPTAFASLSPQQELYKKTLVAAEKGDSASVQKGLKQLKQYPLKPYIIYAELRSRLNTLRPADALDFSRRYSDTPLEGRLRWALTTSLGKRNEWQAFRELYPSLDRPSAEQQCYWGRSELATGHKEAAYTLAARLWVEGHSQPDACDPLFDSWMKSGGLKDRHAHDRALAALEEGNISLARYAAKQASQASTKAQLDKAIELFLNPKSLLTNAALVTPKTPDHRRLLMLAVNRLRRSDLDAAIDLWVRDRARLSIPAEEQSELSVRMGTLKAKHYDPDSESALARIDPEFRLEELTEWRARLALKRLDWVEVERLIGKLPANKQMHERWQYWLSMAKMKQGTDVTTQLKTLSGDRTFYGFLAAELSHSPFSLDHEPIAMDAHKLKELEATPPFQRMRELYELGELYDARSEWNNATRDLSPDDQHMAAHLVKRWGWHTQAIRGAIQSEQWNDLDIRFPDPYPELFVDASERAGITSTWATAIARQESAFWETARSRVGARGLMQLMPTTARHTAKKHSLPLANLDELYQPRTNINLGSAYLGEMYREFNNNRVYATAAYNAGPHRVKAWMKERGNLPLDIWIETIPFDETRNYVQNVLAFAVIYDRLADRPARLLSDSERKLLAYNQPQGKSDKL
ncbi:Soluble lytic murein transglycosylase precursor [Marinobacterium lacunae]|uniref:Soluble lytic murein transglycosylase n=1 Tax=Marinobacterium lacunae TaxID=1232683 RepID=A0A081FW97_9GAMM|nr:transglycosylase SLT domain-containing protein [Marinobacterium lacunae]KEA62802.1 Soluble lytic murein transglycosylase precursor [Marinobacterium lacunae]